MSKARLELGQQAQQLQPQKEHHRNPVTADEHSYFLTTISHTCLRNIFLPIELSFSLITAADETLISASDI